MSGTARHPNRVGLAESDLAADVLPGSHLYTSVRVVEQTGSTNADLLAAASSGAIQGAVLVAERQTAGRGRLDRSWQSQPGASLTFSVLLRPSAVPVASRGWLPLLTGVAAVSALRAQTGLDVVLKWPNDVLSGGGGKLAGILAEQAGDAVVVGIGLNVSATESELPGGHATSLWLAGATDTSRPAILTELLSQLERWYLRWSGGLRPGDAESCGLRESYLGWCATVGRDVRVEMPGGKTLTGHAIDVDSAGRLLVSTADGVHAISAGDVVHVRGSQQSC
jgi:BirA family biotin operon repressor/biotin-[acetyl-CoA-carboxylase] ligase